MDPRPAATDDRIDVFLRLACLTYSEPYDPAPAQAMLAREPELARATVATQAACGEHEALTASLRDDPGAVSRESGPYAWPPLLYLCYSRLDTGDPVAAMQVLLSAGADPNSGFLWRGLPSAFTALTGVLGGGERDEPAHPHAIELAALLLAAGADPNDNQALYNRQFRPDDSHLSLLLGHGAGHPHSSPWRDRLGSAYPSAEEMVAEHLRSAALWGFTSRVRTLLENGVDPNTRGYHPWLGDATAFELAVRHGHRAAAALLEQAGGHSCRLDT